MNIVFSISCIKRSFPLFRKRLMLIPWQMPQRMSLFSTFIPFFRSLSGTICREKLCHLLTWGLLLLLSLFFLY
jgi:hypothetical protein